MPPRSLSIRKVHFLYGKWLKKKKPLVSFPVTAGWQFGRVNEGLGKMV
jgi:hypothetical protein